MTKQSPPGKNKTITKTKKIAPYPLMGTIQVASQPAPQPLKVHRLTMDGVIVEVGKAFVRVGQSYKITFVLPVMNFTIETEGRVMKTYDKPTGGGVERLAEMRIPILSDQQKKAVQSYLVAIKQIGLELKK